jgi:ATP-dependent protease ClpP protease subunit
MPLSLSSSSALDSSLLKAPALAPSSPAALRFGFAGVDSFAHARQSPSMDLPSPDMVEVMGICKVQSPRSPKDNFIVKLTEGVSNNSATAVCTALQEIEGWYKNPDGTLNKELVEKKPVVFSIRSPGGSTYDALRIIEQMEHMQEQGIKIITYADGIVASAGSLLVAAGTPGQRYIGAHSAFHMHESSSGIIGKFSDSIGAHEQWKRLQGELNELLAKYSQGKKKPEDFAKEAKHDIFPAREDVVKIWGLADKIGKPDELYLVDGSKLEAEEKKAKAKAEAGKAQAPAKTEPTETAEPNKDKTEANKDKTEANADGAEKLAKARAMPEASKTLAKELAETAKRLLHISQELMEKSKKLVGI